MAENKEAPGVTLRSLQALVDEFNAKDPAQQLKVIELEGHLLLAPADLDESTIDLAGIREQLEREIGDHHSTKANLANALESLTEATGIIDGQKETIAEQAAKIIDLQTKPAEFPIIEVAKVKYEVQGKGFKYKGVDYTVAQLLADKALQKELVGKGIGFLVKKEG